MDKVAPCFECRHSVGGWCDRAATYDCRGLKEDGSPAIVAVGDCPLGHGHIESFPNRLRVRMLRRELVLPF